GSGFLHNVAFEGDYIFVKSPTFRLWDPADASPRRDLSEDYSASMFGNSIIFSGGQNQSIVADSVLTISSVQINKTSENNTVEIDSSTDVFTIDTSLEVLRGRFVTNGLLDANSGGVNPDGSSQGATVVINRDGDGAGVLDRGSADRAYVSDDDEHTPRKVKYVGSESNISGDEIPGTASGSPGGFEIFLHQLEVFLSDEAAVITLGKDFTIGESDKEGGSLIITRGILDVGSSVIRLANTVSVKVGDGSIQRSEGQGGFDFPTGWIPFDEPDGFGRDFEVGEDGIDLLYFGTTNRTVGLEWPPSGTDVPGRDEDPDVIRDLTISTSPEDDVLISLREDDHESRINGDLILTDGFLQVPFLQVPEKYDFYLDNAVRPGFSRKGGPGGNGHIIGNVCREIPVGFPAAGSSPVGFPVGTANPFLYRLATYTFHSTDPTNVATTLCVNHLNSTPSGNAGFPIGPITGPADFYWLVTSSVGLDPSQTFDLEFLGSGFTPFGDVQGIRIIRRRDGNDSNSWTQQTGSYSNSLTSSSNSDIVDPLVRVSGTTGGLEPEGSLFTFGRDPTNTALVGESEIPSEFRLHQNYPNPFNPVTSIVFDLPQKSPIRLVVYDILGREVDVLIDSIVPPGRHEIAFDAKNLPSGTYFYRLRSDQVTLTRTLILFK
ncbi:MAG: T9SS type A sorting domain-containing protein, partial [Bacteroidetes bacterium]|nr:T9SS type A sorting domain-containing protein [Bacteroidota bacterium]